MQLYGANIERLCEGGALGGDRGAHVIDSTWAARLTKITKRTAAASCWCDPDNTVRMIEKIIKSPAARSIDRGSFRWGWDDTCIVAPKLAARLENAGVSLVTISLAEPRKMRFSGEHALMELPRSSRPCESFR